jgi:hypothetical protein
MSKFKASDYNAYNSKFGFDKYKQLYDLMQELFNLLPFDEKNYEDDSFFVFSGMNVFIDKENGSYCEIINSGWLPMDERIKLHKQKLAAFKKDIIQLNLF